MNPSVSKALVVGLLLVGIVLPVGAASGSPWILVISKSKETPYGRAVMDELKKVRHQAGLTKDTCTIANLSWADDRQRAVIERDLGLTPADLPYLSTAIIQDRKMISQPNRNRPGEGLDPKVVAYYLINEWARRKGDVQVPAWSYKPPAKPAPPAGAASSLANGKDSSTLLLVPSGGFWMGSTEGEVDELPPHLVELKSYYIGQREVTVGQFRRFVAETGYETRAEKEGHGWCLVSSGWEKRPGATWKAPAGDGRPAEDAEPVRQVAVLDAQAYCQWAGVRLPTEAEWEKSARGTAGRQYPWGERFDAARVSTGASGPPPAGSRPAGASPYGVLDQAGGVREWTSTPYALYSQAVVSPDARSGRTSVRGGSWSEENPRHYRGAFRFGAPPQVGADRIGFRVARDL